MYIAFRSFILALVFTVFSNANINLATAIMEETLINYPEKVTPLVLIMTEEGAKESVASLTKSITPILSKTSGTVDDLIDAIDRNTPRTVTATRLDSTKEMIAMEQDVVPGFSWKDVFSCCWTTSKTVTPAVLVLASKAAEIAGDDEHEVSNVLNKINNIFAFTVNTVEDYVDQVGIKVNKQPIQISFYSPPPKSRKYRVGAIAGRRILKTDS